MTISRAFLQYAFFTICSGLLVSAAADGMLTVRTDPEGIEVWLDDNFLGDSPIIAKKLKPGRYSLKLVDPVQHSSTTEEVFIQNDETTVIEKTIKGKFGSLRVTSDPEGAQVFVSTELGKSPVNNDFMNPGKYRIEIKSPNKRYHSSIQEIVIPRGETVSVSQTLEREKILDSKAYARLALGAGGIASFIWALVEQGNYKMYAEQASRTGPSQSNIADIDNKKSGAAVGRTLGIILGSVCIVGLEVVAFF